MYDAFYMGLAAKVMDELAALELPPKLDYLITLATDIDHCIRERSSEMASHHTWYPSARSPTQRSPPSSL